MDNDGFTIVKSKKNNKNTKKNIFRPKETVPELLSQEEIDQFIK